ncbi:MAG: SDR family NAD(P)-dependent oxidoreductase [Acetobacteraceae bacterium]|nr:SDR family NAD(P)-dependent oxidoreductase [Acetobacteraceae bacterium]
MTGLILVTGGAGFIGRHVVRVLLEKGHAVRVVDSLIEQVHHGREPDPILDETDFLQGDVRDRELMGNAVRGVDKVVHLAAEVGVGQSMYAIDRYVSANDHGSAVLFQALSANPVARVVVASSMSIYGEGLYRDAAGGFVESATRPAQQHPLTGWDPAGPCGEKLIAVATPEWKRPELASVYAVTKYVQERLTLTIAPAYGMEGVALRLFNVYGPGQALCNPYTGVLAIFASRLANGERPLVFEDGEQRRDFVHVDDVARAFLLALEAKQAAGHVLNIGSGSDVSVTEVAQAMARAMRKPHLCPEITNQARVGDIRNCFADITRARQTLGFRPRRGLDDSLEELAAWVRRQRAIDRVAEARAELEERGLVT